jgi:hypothetical protein
MFTLHHLFSGLLALIFLLPQLVFGQEVLIANSHEIWFVSAEQEAPKLLFTASSPIKAVRFDKERGMLAVMDEMEVVHQLEIPSLELLSKGWHLAPEFKKLPKSLDISSDPSFSPDLKLQAIARYNDLYVLTADFEVFKVLPIPLEINVTKLYWIDQNTLLLETWDSFALYDLIAGKVLKEFPFPKLDWPVFQLSDNRDTLYGMESEFYGRSTKAITPLNSVNWEYSEVEKAGLSGTMITNGTRKGECDYLYTGKAVARICEGIIDTLTLLDHFVQQARVHDSGNFCLLTDGKETYWDDTLENVAIHFFNRQTGIVTASVELPKREERWGKELFITLPENWRSILPEKKIPKEVSVSVQKRLEAEEIFFSDEGNYFVTSDGNELTVWDGRSMRQIKSIPCRFLSIRSSGIQIVESKSELACMCEVESDTEIQVYDYLTGELKASYADNYSSGVSIQGFDLAADRLFLFVNEALEIRSMSRDDETIQVIPERIGNVELDPKGNYILGLSYGESTNKIAWVELSSGKINEIRANKKFPYVSHFELAADGEHLLIVYPYEGNVLEGKGESILEVYNTRSKKIVREQQLLWGLNRAQFSPDGSKVVYLFYDTIVKESGMIEDYAISEFDLQTRKVRQIVSFDPGVIDAPIRFRMHPNKEELIYSNHDQLYRVHVRDGNLIRTSPKGLKEEYTQLNYDPETKDVFVRVGQKIQVLNLKEPTKYQEIIMPNDFKYLQSTEAGSCLWNKTEWVENGKDFDFEYILTDYFRPEKRISILRRNESINRYYYFRNRDQILLQTFTTGEECNWVQLDLSSGKELSRMRFDKSYFGLSSEIYFPNDSALIFINMKDKNQSGECHIYSLENGLKKVDQIDGYNFVMPTMVKGVYVVEKPNKQYQYQRDFYIYDGSLRKEISFLGTTNESTNGVVVTPSNELIVCSKDRILRAKLDGNSILQPVVKLNDSYPLQLVLLGSDYAVVDYNSIQVYDMHDSLNYSIITSGETGALFQLQSGHYLSPGTNSLNHLNFLVSGKVYPYDELDLQFNRPDLVMAQLEFPSQDLIVIYEEAFRKRQERLGAFNSEFKTAELPFIEIQEAHIDFTNLTGEAVLPYTCASKEQLKQLDVWVNNVPLYGKNGIPLSGQGGINRTIPIKLSAGLNRIQLACTDVKGRTSLRSLIEVENKSIQLKRPKRVIISIACSNYANPKYKLNYAVKDGKDVLEFFDDSAFYVQMHSYFDEAAVSSIVGEIREILMQTEVQDQVIVFLSGHGILDKQKQWWFATHDIDFNTPEKAGISYAELDKLLDGIPARNKVLLMDACNSGEVDASFPLVKDTIITLSDSATLYAETTKGNLFGEMQMPAQGRSSFEIMKEAFLDISRGSGAQVITAASGNSYAYEYSQFKNGVFTYALREALMQGLGDLDNNGSIEVLELKKYVESRVLELTEGKQKPTSRQENLENNFRIK